MQPSGGRRLAAPGRSPCRPCSPWQWCRSGAHMKSTWLGLLILAIAATPAASWDIPPDNGTMGETRYRRSSPATTIPKPAYTADIDFIDFSAHGQEFTQVVVTLTPDRPRLRNGKKLVVVGGEPGSEYGMDFVHTVEGKEGPAVWLAKRGVTFVALTRVGRWNFLAPTKDGSWESVPLGQRMPMFSAARRRIGRRRLRGQRSGVPRQHVGRRERDLSLSEARARCWKSRCWRRRRACSSRATAWRSRRRFPTAELARAVLGHVDRRRDALSAGEILHAGRLSRLGHELDRARLCQRPRARGNFNDVYEHSALRVRERGLDDFEFYTKDIDPQTRAEMVAGGAARSRASRAPRMRRCSSAPAR